MNEALIEGGMALGLAVVIFFAGHYVGAKGVQDDWNADKLAHTSRENDAIRGRLEQNAVVAVKQKESNDVITKDKSEALAPVIKHISTDRVRVGPAICGGSPAPATPEDAPRSDGADSRGRVVREDIERDLRALKVAVEKDLATGRSCQEFGKANGLYP